MKTHFAFAAMLVAIALTMAPLSAQRPSGGGGHSAGTSHGGSFGGHSGGFSGGHSSRPTGGYSGGYSGGHSSRPSGGYSGGYNSGNSSRSNSYSSSRPNTATYSSRPSSSSSYSGSHSSKGYSHSSYGTTSRPSTTTSRPNATTSRPSYTGARSGGVSAGSASTYARYGNKPVGKTARPAHGTAGTASHNYYKAGTTTRPGTSAVEHRTPATARPGAVTHPAGQRYGRAGRPGPMPRAHRPMRPAPYFHHPYHHHMVHMHPIFWDPYPFHTVYWPGFWHYCHGYWHDYHVNDIVVVREYVRENYKTDLVTYVMSGDYMYALVVADNGDHLLQVFDKNDNLLATQKVNDRYTIMEVDKENGGCWLMKKNQSDPLLFLYNDGELLIYEAAEDE